MKKWLLILNICLLAKLSLAQESALIPQPLEYKAGKGSLSLHQFKSIYYDTAFEQEARLLQSWLKDQHVEIALQHTGNAKHAFQLLKDNSLPDTAAYAIKITENNIVLRATAATGIYYALQTLQQLLVGGRLPVCDIYDQPAFQWRGYMVDVGRNYQSLSQLKQQIAEMARYKLNIFQFHFTEDIAWRWQVPGFPQLTADTNMIRNKGKFYTNAEIHELIQYCQERHILFVPEIDMPGHSAAFRRAMGTDMQTDSGLKILKQVVGAFIEEFKLPYLHVGGDEVKIINKDFLPEMIRFIESKGVKTLGWDPGGNIPSGTIHQLWMREGAVKPHVQYLDSRHLYLNHMDPLESVMTIYQRQLCDTTHGDSFKLGAILCLWNDRRVADESDLLKMNPVYPAMLTFAERSWKGGGNKGWRTNIDPSAAGDFKQFENRLLQHQQRFFQGKAFPYSLQGSMIWDIITPDGKIMQTIGGTVVLRHFWAPLVQGVLPAPQENTTVYATTKIYCKRDTVMPVWIGFYNISRSVAGNTPAKGKWDDRGSIVQVNDRIIAPPDWQHPGRKGNLEEPLADESYEYRAPVYIPFRAGENTVKITLPVHSFKSSDWNNPVKWMFTFLPLTKTVNND